jgi:hypothetical protein
MLLHACPRIDTAPGAAVRVRLKHLLQLLHLKLLLCLQRCLATTQAPACSKTASKRLLISKRCYLTLALLLDALLAAPAAGLLTPPAGLPCVPVHLTINNSPDAAVALYHLMHVSLNIAKPTACAPLPIRRVRCALDNSSLARGSIPASAP